MKKNLSYEAAMARLEEIVARLGEGTATLDETLKLFQEGTELAAFCDKKLTDANLKIEQLSEPKQPAKEREHD